MLRTGRFQLVAEFPYLLPQLLDFRTAIRSIHGRRVVDLEQFAQPVDLPGLVLQRLLVHGIFGYR